MTKIGETPQDPVLARLAPHWSDARTEGNLAATFDRLGGRRRRRRTWSAVMVGAAAVLLAGGGARRLAHQARPAREMVALPAPGTKPEAFRAGAAAPARVGPDAPLRLKDGSEVRPLDARTRIEVALESAERVEINLSGGAAAFAVVPGRARSFVVRLVRVQFTVLGTRFELTPEGDRVRLVVEEGRVQVTWPGGSDVAGPGTSAWFPPSDRETLTALRLRFHAHAARRDYPAAYRTLVSAPGVIGNSAEDLMLAADAARLSGHAAEAVPYLERLLREHSSDARAPLAAFTIGRISLAQLGRPGQAADMFALSRRLAPAGALASDALARETEAAAAAGDGARARRLATEFVSRYPSGRRTQAVRRAGGLE